MHTKTTSAAIKIRAVTASDTDKIVNPSLALGSSPSWRFASTSSGMAGGGGCSSSGMAGGGGCSSSGMAGGGSGVL